MASTAPEVHSDALTAPLDGPPAPTDAGAAGPAVLADAPVAKQRKTTKRKAPVKDLPLSKEEPQEELKPLPEDASGLCPLGCSYQFSQKCSA